MWLKWCVLWCVVVLCESEMLGLLEMLGRLGLWEHGGQHLTHESKPLSDGGCECAYVCGHCFEVVCVFFLCRFQDLQHLPLMLQFFFLFVCRGPSLQFFMSIVLQFGLEENIE